MAHATLARRNIGSRPDNAMSRFETTRWSLVLQASSGTPQARTALEALCRTYRPAVVAYVRGRGYAADAADDLVQAFFLRFIDQAWYADADRERGRFRTYLLTTLKRHLIGSNVEAHARKRGGGMRIESIDEADEDFTDEGNPERHFEKTWAMTVVGHAFSRLREEADRAGKRALFDALSEFLAERPDDADYARAAAALGLRRNTLAVAVHRLRHRLKELIEAELADTARSEADLAAELHDLHDALGLGAGHARGSVSGNPPF